MFTLADTDTDTASQRAVIKVIGVGGGGGNAVQHMVNQDIQGVDFICANTDVQALHSLSAGTLLQLGSETTKGLGAGADPAVGQKAALEDKTAIAEVLEGADMVFIAAGMGGGTGTGAAPVVAEVAKGMNILTVAVVTKPFEFEGKKRNMLADEGIKSLAQNVDSLITILNEKLLPTLGPDTLLLDAFSVVDDVLSSAVQGIADLIMRPGMINLDFADVKTVMSEMGMAMIGSGIASGDQRARDATEAAIHSPLLADIDLNGARGILVNMASNVNISLREYHAVSGVIKEFASESATYVCGTVIDPEMNDALRVTVVLTGLGSQPVQNQDNRRTDNNETPNYSNYERPPGLRKVDTNGDKSSQDISYLDIPAFLRRQAD